MRFFYLLLFFFITAVFADNPQKIWRLNWSDQAGDVGKLYFPGGVYGPQTFCVAHDTLLILDNAHDALKVFVKNRQVAQERVPANGRDFVYFSKGNYILLSDNQVTGFSAGKAAYHYSAPPGEVIRTLKAVAPGTVRIGFSDGSAKVSNAQGRALHKAPVVAAGRIRVFKENPFSGRVELSDAGGHVQKSIALTFSALPLASLQALGRDGQGNIYVHTEFFISQVPLKVKRQAQVYSAGGIHLATINLPLNNYLQTYRDLFVGVEGLYQMVNTPQGVDILKWDVINTKSAKNPRVLYFPEEYKNIEPAVSPLQEAEVPEGAHPLRKISDFPPVTPNEALDIAAKYVNLYWDCQAKNLTNGTITDQYGYQVETPYWLSVGRMRRVPYKWGGFETVKQFTDEISAGKYAGDKYTSKCCGTASAVGVDCSGFVSRCWKLPTHYSTRMMDDDITKAYDSWDKTKPGDACHKVGHVRLIVAHRGDGSLDMVEAAGFNWRVSYTNYYYYEITAYTPRYYINMGEMARAPLQPNLQEVCYLPQGKLRWTSGGDAAGGYVLELSADDQNWDKTESLPADSTEYRFDLQNDQALYFRLRAYSADDASVLGTISDTYGLYRRDDYPRALIVDGFDRTSASQGSWRKAYHPFAATLGRALQYCGVPFETAPNEALTDSLVELNDYDAVFWVLGDESTVDETFSDAEQTLVKSYLQQGGKLFISGSEVAWDLVRRGSASDTTFFHQFLKADYLRDDAKSHAVVSNDSLFVNLALDFDDGTHGVYPEDYPDVIVPLNGSQKALIYSTGETAAVCYTGFFPGGQKAGALFYMGFPFETIYEEAQRDSLMKQVAHYFELDQKTEPPAPLPQTLTLLGNYPNPFNGQTHIRYQTPAAGAAELTVYSVRGRKVCTYRQQVTAGGTHSMDVTAGRPSSGTYFYSVSFKYGSLRQTRFGKFVLVK